MPALSFIKAKEKGLINEKEMERFALMFMAMADECKPSGKAYQIAAKQAGNRVKSFQTMFTSTLKKLRDNDCYCDEDDTDATPTSAAMTPKTLSDRKRKAKSEGAGEETPSKKTARGKKAHGFTAVKTEETVDDGRMPGEISG